MRQNVLSTRQQRALELLLAGQTITEAARAVGINRSTLTRWLASPHVRQALGEQRQRRMDEIHHRLAALTDRALDSLGAVLEGEAPPGAKVRAALGVIDVLLKVREQTELVDRIERLERIVVEREDLPLPNERRPLW